MAPTVIPVGWTRLSWVALPVIVPIVLAVPFINS